MKFTIRILLMYDLNFETEIKFVQQVLITVVRDKLHYDSNKTV